MSNIKASSPNKLRIKEPEFVALMAFLMSNVALCIDAILPALTDIGKGLSVTETNDLQLVIFMIFLGLGSGELVFGTLSDSFGRKPIVLVGVGIFIIASLVCIWAPSLWMLLLGRFIQGIGLSAARSVSIAIIRDTYGGDQMARIMSFIMTIFILVPMLAPLLGQFILEAFNWQAIFYFQLIFIGLTVLWFWLRQVETLKMENRISFTKHLFTDGVQEYFRFKKPVVYTIISGIVQGTFIAYLGASQQIFQGQFGLISEFPYIFGGLAFGFGIAALLNGFLVLKIGMIKIVNISTYAFILTALVYILLFFNSINPSIEILIAFLFIQFMALGFIFGNLSALAMEPIGHIAGIGAAIFSFASMFLAVLVAYWIGQYIHATAMPLFVGFFITGVLSILLMRMIKHNKNTEPIAKGMD